MTTPNHPARGSVMPFQRYLDATHAARDQYLATTYAAHRLYLTGPWPDRVTYQKVETDAWNVYYTAARLAWQRYTNELSPGEDPPAPQGRNNPTPSAGYSIDEFDQRQETYLAADPNRRDNP